MDLEFSVRANFNSGYVPESRGLGTIYLVIFYPAFWNIYRLFMFYVSVSFLAHGYYIRRFM